MFCCGNMSDVTIPSAHQNQQESTPAVDTSRQNHQAKNEDNKNNDDVGDAVAVPTASSLIDDNTTNSIVKPTASSTADSHAAGGAAVAWSISFAPSRGATGKGLKNKKEKAALEANKNIKSKNDTPANSGSDADAMGGQSTEASATATAGAKRKSATLLGVVTLDEAAEVDVAISVPRNLTTTREDMLARNHFDQNRWLCLSRPQYKRSCGVSSLTSVWNALYSRVGYGELPPISQEEVMTILGFAPPFQDIRWGPFTGNTSLMRWFHKINKAKGVTLGKAFYFWKPHGSGRTIGLDDEQAEQMTLDALRNPKMALIYHCKNHYFVPIGFRLDPRAPRLAMLPKLEKSETDTRILIGEPSRGGMPSIHERLFTDIAKDLHTEAPYSFNIRHPERGVEKREKMKKVGGTLHCFIGFRSDVEGNEDELMLADGEEDEEKENVDEDDE